MSGNPEAERERAEQLVKRFGSVAMAEAAFEVLAFVGAVGQVVTARSNRAKHDALMRVFRRFEPMGFSLLALDAWLTRHTPTPRGPAASPDRPGSGDRP